MYRKIRCVIGIMLMLSILSSGVFVEANNQEEVHTYEEVLVPYEEEQIFTEIIEDNTLVENEITESFTEETEVEESIAEETEVEESFTEETEVEESFTEETEVEESFTEETEVEESFTGETEVEESFTEETEVEESFTEETEVEESVTDRNEIEGNEVEEKNVEDECLENEINTSYEEFISTTESYYTMYNRTAPFHWTLDDELLLCKQADLEEWMVYKDNVTCYKTWKNLVIYATDTGEIHYMNNDTSCDTVLYCGSGSIIDISGCIDFIMFVEDDYLMRMHIPSGTIDRGVRLNNGQGMFILDNHTVCWNEFVSSLSAGTENVEIHSFAYNFEEEKCFDVTNLDVDSELYRSTCSSGYFGDEMMLGINDDVPALWSIRRKLTEEEWIYAPDPGDPDVPLDDYGYGSKFTILYDGGTECMGFANYVYHNRHGHNKSKDKFVDHTSGVLYDESMWRNLHLYTYIRIGIDNEHGHSAILWDIRKSENGVVLYEANTDHKNGVYQNFVSYEDLASNRVVYLCYPESKHYNYTEHYDAYNHWKVCSDCGIVFQKVQHSMAMSYIDGAIHRRSCTICGYSESGEAHAYGGYNIDGDTHWRQCSTCGRMDRSAHQGGAMRDAGNGTHYTACTICGKTLTSSVHVYTHSSADSANHRGVCQCGATTLGSHNMFIYNTSSTAHQYKCTICGHMSHASHNFTVSQNNASSHKKTCTTCGYSQTVAHTITYTNASASSHAYKCTVCGHTGVASHKEKSSVKTKVATSSVCTRTTTKCECGYTLASTTDYSHRYSGKICLDCNYRK